MSLLRDKSLRFKVNFFIFLFILLVVGLGIAMFRLAERSLKQELFKRGEVMVRRLADSHAYQVSLGLADELKPIINQVMREKGVDYIEFVDTKGNVIHTSDGKFIAQSDPARRPEAYRTFDHEVLNKLALEDSENAGMRKITGPMGQKLYDFFAPVVLVSREMAVKDSHLGLTGENLDSRNQQRRIVGMVRVSMLTTTLDEARRKLFWVLGIAVLLAIVIGLGAAYLLSTLTIQPVIHVAEAASDIARGDLNQQVEALSQDELGLLASSFNSMAENLSKMIRRIHDAYMRVDQGREQILHSTMQVLDASKSQVVSVKQISSEINAMNASLIGVAESVENLSASSEETSSWIMEMAKSIEEVTSHIKSLTSSVDETAASISEMVMSIQQVDKSNELLSNLISDAAFSIREMESSIRQVEKNAANSRALSDQVTGNAEMGMKSVERTITGMERIRDAVSKSSEVITQLGSSSVEIGKILTVIEDLAEQTNLLALNAAIIASQAGEHGKGFAIVAEEIRELAERTTSSTKEIDTLIKTVQRDVSNAVQTMQGGSQTVEEGVKLSFQAGENLKKILDSARTSADMAKGIAKATEEQSKGIQSINQAIDQIREKMKQITAATSEQKTESEQIISAVENMREMTGFVSHATMEQLKGSKQVTMAIENVTEMVSQIMKATGEQARGSEQIVKVVEVFKEINQKNLDSVGDMDRALTLLLEQTSILKQEISIFKT
jgi:methyl-accepting chemotaxis protein